MKLHKSITMDRVLEAVESQMFGLENPGFCIACGDEASGCEPDAERYECESCGKKSVYGAEALLYEVQS